jgi:hypothetical protein
LDNNFFKKNSENKVFLGQFKWYKKKRVIIT